MPCLFGSPAQGSWACRTPGGRGWVNWSLKEGLAIQQHPSPNFSQFFGMERNPPVFEVVETWFTAQKKIWAIWIGGKKHAGHKGTGIKRYFLLFSLCPLGLWQHETSKKSLRRPASTNGFGPPLTQRTSELSNHWCFRMVSQWTTSEVSVGMLIFDISSLLNWKDFMRRGFLSILSLVPFHPGFLSPPRHLKHIWFQAKSCKVLHPANFSWIGADFDLSSANRSSEDLVAIRSVTCAHGRGCRMVHSDACIETTLESFCSMLIFKISRLWGSKFCPVRLFCSWEHEIFCGKDFLNPIWLFKFTVSIKILWKLGFFHRAFRTPRGSKIPSEWGPTPNGPTKTWASGALLQVPFRIWGSNR